MKRNELLNLTDNDLFDPFFGAISSLFGDEPEERYALKKLDMRCDVTDEGDHFQIAIDMPGVKKEDIHVSLEDGYLVVNAEANRSDDEKDSHGKYVRRERYSGSVSRSFYIGEDIEEKDIKAKLENGCLFLTLPKKEQKAVEEKHTIAIE